MDRTSTMSSSQSSAPAAVSAYPSPTQTAVDLRAMLDAKVNDATEKAPSTSSRTDRDTTKSEYDASAHAPSADAHADANGFSALDTSRTHETVLPPDVVLSQRKKWTLLMIFSLGFFIDIWSYSAFFVFTDPISEDLGVPLAQQSWVITSYAVTFSAFLLFWGRVSDLYSAKPVFSFGFLALGILDIVISFLPDRYSFFILRAISGIAGSALIPASYRLITAVFEKHELSKAFTLFGMAGAISNVTGVLGAGAISFVPTHGQGAPWRWFFRLLAAVIIPVAIGSLYWIPKPKGAASDVGNKWRRLDLPGSFSMLFAIILLILGLTLGASDGWKSAAFLVPFLLSFVFFAVFFVWEARQPQQYALLPAQTWRIPNFTILIVFSLYIYGWWSVNFLPLVEISLRVLGEKPIIAAVRTLPQGISAGAMVIVFTRYSGIMARPRWPIVIAMVSSIVGYILFIQWDRDQSGWRYWAFVFPGSILGSAGMQAVLTGVNVGVMTSVEPEMAGVAGAVLQVALQVGSAVALSVQAGLLTVNKGWLYNFSNVRTSWLFELGWGVVWLIAFLIFYRPAKKGSDADKAENGEIIMAH